MAAEMLEKILDAEKKSREKIEQTKAEAETIVSKARDEGRKIVENAVADAEKQKKQDIETCNNNAKILIEEKVAEAKAVCEKMADDCKKKADDCTKIIIEELLS